MEIYQNNSSGFEKVKNILEEEIMHLREQNRSIKMGIGAQLASLPD